jgi:hypothetical protein
MSFWNGVTPQSVASAQDGFKEFQIGENEAYVKSAKEDISESGNPMLVITFVNDEGAEIRHYIVDGEFKQQKLKQFYIAFGIPIGSQNFHEWLNKRGIVVCKQGKPNRNGNIYNQVSYLRPRPGANTNRSSVDNTQRSQQAQQPARQPDPEHRPEDEFEDDIPF